MACFYCQPPCCCNIRVFCCWFIFSIHFYIFSSSFYFILSFKQVKNPVFFHYFVFRLEFPHVDCATPYALSSAPSLSCSHFIVYRICFFYLIILAHATHVSARQFISNSAARTETLHIQRGKFIRYTLQNDDKNYHKFIFKSKICFSFFWSLPNGDEGEGDDDETAAVDRFDQSVIHSSIRVIVSSNLTNFSYTLSALAVYLLSTCHRICRTIHSERSVFIKWNKYFVLSSSVHKRQPVSPLCLLFVNFVVVESCVHCSHFFHIANGGE